MVGKPALVEVNRKERGRKPKRPFNQRMKRGTFTNYTTWWKQLLSYVVRCEELEEDERPAFKYTQQQRAGFARPEAPPIRRRRYALPGPSTLVAALGFGS